MNIARAIAGIFALTGFSVSCLASMRGGASASHALWNALLVLVFCYCIGHCAGWIVRKTISEHVSSRVEHPARPTAPIEAPLKS
jgi:hypothetical protein